jgi:membrane protein implicated in regulation of membrane protease activity
MDNLLTNPVWFWLIAMIIFIIFEVATLGLTTMWFALGSLAAMAVAVVGGKLWLQIAVFVIVSIVTMFCFRKVALNLFNQNREKTNADGLIGKKGIVTEKISNLHATGQVMISGLEWTARSVNDEVTIENGSVVVIREIRGVKLIVEKEA